MIKINLKKISVPPPPEIDLAPSKKCSKCKYFENTLIPFCRRPRTREEDFRYYLKVFQKEHLECKWFVKPGELDGILFNGEEDGEGSSDNN